MSFPNVARCLVALLADMVGGSAHIGTETPADLQARLPFIRVGRMGGADDGLTDYSTIDVDYFGADYTSATEGSEAVRDFLTRTYHIVGSAVLDSATTVTAPRELPWLGTGVRRFTATYRVATRRIA